MTVGFGLHDVKTKLQGDPQISKIYYAIHVSMVSEVDTGVEWVCLKWWDW